MTIAFSVFHICNFNSYVWAVIFGNQIITEWLIAGTCLLKTLSGQLQSEEEFTGPRFSHFELCIAVKFKSLSRKLESFDLPFGTVMTKLKLFLVIERKMYHARQTFEIN